MESWSLRFGDLSLEGRSRAGDETWFRVHPPGIGLDAGRGPPKLIGARDLFLSHGHLDHALGVPALLSHRALHRLGPTRIFCPPATAEPLRRFVQAAAALSEESYLYEVLPMEPGEQVRVGPRLAVRAFRTEHLVPSLGYHLIRMQRHLRPRFRGLAPERIAELRRAGEEVTQEAEELWLSYCGDTGTGVFELEPALFGTSILLLECTFVSPETRERGARFGHLHLEDLVPLAPRFRNRAIVLHHLSRRHRGVEVRERIEKLLPELADRIHLVPPEREGG